MTRARRAFTLLETLITIFLVALVFGLFMVLLRDSFMITRRLSSKDEARRAAQIGLDRILCEAREACEWVNVPTSPAVSAQFEMLKVTAVDEVRFPLAPPAYPLPQAFLTGPWCLIGAVTFDPQQAVHTERIRYRMQADQLLREVGPTAGPLGSPLVLATGISGLSCWSEPGQMLVVVLSYPELPQIQRIVGRAVCAGVERN